MYLCDNDGNIAPDKSSCSVVFTVNTSPVTSNWNLYTYSIATNSFSSVQAIFDYLNNSTNGLLKFYPSASGYHYEFSLSDFVENLYIGDSWSNKVNWTADFDLNLSPTSQYVTVNSPTNVIYLDLNGFMHDLYDNPTIIYNYVINNSIDGDGNPVDPTDFNPISKYVTIPSSGISIGSDFFRLPSGLTLFDTYIADLWRNTKDMVLYCADILNVFTLEDGGGLAYIVYGAISVGVIGGIFSKFLL